MVLAKGEFDVSVGDDGVEVWVTQMGPFANMNTGFIDRENNIAIVIDPYDGAGWIRALKAEGSHCRCEGHAQCLSKNRGVGA